jgi:hypothetical protein
MTVSSKRLPEVAVTICAADDLYMKLGAEAAGLVATGARACTSQKLPRPVSYRSSRSETLANILSVIAYAPSPKRKFKTEHADIQSQGLTKRP